MPLTNEQRERIAISAALELEGMTWDLLRSQTANPLDDGAHVSLRSGYQLSYGAKAILQALGILPERVMAEVGIWLPGTDLPAGFRPSAEQLMEMERIVQAIGDDRYGKGQVRVIAITAKPYPLLATLMLILAGANTTQEVVGLMKDILHQRKDRKEHAGSVQQLTTNMKKVGDRIAEAAREKWARMQGATDRSRVNAKAIAGGLGTPAKRNRKLLARIRARDVPGIIEVLDASAPGEQDPILDPIWWLEHAAADGTPDLHSKSGRIEANKRMRSAIGLLEKVAAHRPRSSYPLDLHSVRGVFKQWILLHRPKDAPDDQLHG